MENNFQKLAQAAINNSLNEHCESAAFRMNNTNPFGNCDVINLLHIPNAQKENFHDILCYISFHDKHHLIKLGEVNATEVLNNEELKEIYMKYKDTVCGAGWNVYKKVDEIIFGTFDYDTFRSYMTEIQVKNKKKFSYNVEDIIDNLSDDDYENFAF